MSVAILGQESCSMATFRHREVANSFIDMPQYLGFLNSWHEAYTGQWPGLETFLEPQKASSLRQVVPSAVIRLHELLGIMLDTGLQNCVVYPAKWEAACISFAGKKGIMSRAQDCRHLGASFATHSYSCLSLLRIYVQEDSRCSLSMASRKHPKTGPFRKAMSFADQEVMRTLAAKVKLSSSDAKQVDPLPVARPTSPSPAADESKTLADCLVLDEDGFPTIFSVALAEQNSKHDGFPTIFSVALAEQNSKHSRASSLGASSVAMTSRASSLAPTEFYDEAGFPMVPDAAVPQETQQPETSQPSVPLQVPVIRPQPTKRRKAMEANAAATPTKRQPSAKSSHKTGKKPGSLLKYGDEVILGFSFAEAKDGRFEIIGRSATTKRIYIGTLRNVAKMNIKKIKDSFQELVHQKVTAKMVVEKFDNFRSSLAEAG